MSAMRTNEAVKAAERVLRRHEDRLGPGSGALLGAASAFFCFAVLPTGLAVRLLAAILIGGAIGYATWRGFGWLDRTAPARLQARFVGEATRRSPLATPVLRRADAHPDAPARRPIFAGSDLGTPLDLIDPRAAPADEPSPPIGAEPEDAEFAPIEPDARVQFEAAAAQPEAVRAESQAPAETVADEDEDEDEDEDKGESEGLEAAPASQTQATALAAMIARLEAGLTRKALALAGAEANVTALRREIRPLSGSLRAAVDQLQRRTAQHRTVQRR